MSYFRVAIDRVNKTFTIPLPKVGTNFIWHCCTSSKDRPVRYPHPSLDESATIKNIDDDVFWCDVTAQELLEHCSDYKMFQIVRNPYDRFVSGIAQELCLGDLIPRLLEGVDRENPEWDQARLEAYYKNQSHFIEAVFDVLSNHTAKSLFDKLHSRGHIIEQRLWFDHIDLNDYDVTWFVMDDMLNKNFYHWCDLHDFKIYNKQFHKVNSASMASNLSEHIRFAVYNQLMPVMYDPRYNKRNKSEIYEFLKKDFEFFAKVSALAYRGAEQ